MATIDYITCSFPYEPFPLTKMPPHEAFYVQDSDIRISRYETAWRLNCGAIVARPHASNKRQKCLFQMSGDALELTREHGVSDLSLLTFLMRERHGKFPRLDVAFDTFDEDASPEELYLAWYNDGAKTHIRTEPKINMRGGGITAYFGSETGDRMLRCYNKAAEIGLLSEAWTRVELQSRNRMAQMMAWNIVENQEIDHIGAASIRDFIDFPEVSWWNALLATGGVEPIKAGRKETDWQRYMENKMIPSIVEHWIKDDRGDRQFIDKMLLSLSALFRKKRKHYLEEHESDTRKAYYNNPVPDVKKIGKEEN